MKDYQKLWLKEFAHIKTSTEPHVFASVMATYYNEILTARGRTNKITITRQMLNYLPAEGFYIHSYPNFKKTLCDKIHEFMKNDSDVFDNGISQKTKEFIYALCGFSVDEINIDEIDDYDYCYIPGVVDNHHGFTCNDCICNIANAYINRKPNDHVVIGTIPLTQHLAEMNAFEVSDHIVPRIVEQITVLHLQHTEDNVRAWSLSVIVKDQKAFYLIHIFD